MKRIGAVITAAGTGDRDGAKKALENIDGMTMAERIVRNFHRAGIKDIVVVTGHQTDELKKALRGQGVVFLENEQYQTAQMLDSAKIGLKYLEDRCEKIMVTPVDVPLFSTKTVVCMKDCEEKIVLPSYKMKSGHPIMIHKDFIPTVLRYQGEGGLKGCIHSFGEKVLYVNVEDEGIAADSTDEENLIRLVEEKQEQMTHVEVKVQLVKRKAFLGPGMITLLKQIHCLGSVREASDKCGISYSKAWTMLRIAESEYEKELVYRQNGGKYGGEANVTAEGLELIRKYELLEKEIQTFADEKFETIFSGQCGCEK